jgi:uncharacterized protein with PQ loop repeat
LPNPINRLEELGCGQPYALELGHPNPLSRQAMRADMENLNPFIGYIGTGFVIGAYVPQIWHLWSEQCSAGISERAYLIWVLSSAIFLGHSITIGDVVFMVTQLVNIVALVVILVLARRYRNQICAAHARQLHIHE